MSSTGIIGRFNHHVKGVLKLGVRICRATPTRIHGFGSGFRSLIRHGPARIAAREPRSATFCPTCYAEVGATIAKAGSAGKSATLSVIFDSL